MNIVGFYNKLVLDGRKLFVLFFLTAILFRILCLVYVPSTSFSYTDSYLWTKVNVFISNPYLSVGISLLCLIFLSLVINGTGVCISMFRVKSILPASMSFLLLSSSVVYIFLSSYIVLAILFSYILFLIYNNYDSENGEYVSLRVGFYSSLASLVSSTFIWYIPILFFCLYLSRNFSLKSFIAFVLGFIPIYIFLFTLSLYLGEVVLLLQTLKSPFIFTLQELPFLHFEVSQYIALVISIVLIVVLNFNLGLKEHGEKVIIRVCLNMLSAIQIFSIFVIMFISNAHYCGYTLLFVTLCLNLPYLYIIGKNKKVLLILIIFNYLSIIAFYMINIFR